MEIDDLRCIVVGSPVELAAENATLVLTGLAGAGDMRAIVALVRALAHELGHDDALPQLDDVRSTSELLAADSVPPLLRIYGAGWSPREFASHIVGLARLAKEAVLDDSFAAFRRMVQRRATLQHEALRAFVLCGVAAQLGMVQRIGETLALGTALGILRPVTNGCCVVAGNDADASMQFGRDFILNKAGASAFLFSVQHEIGHNLLDAVQGYRGAIAGLGQAGALREMAKAMPALLAEACRQRGHQLFAGDARCVRLGSGVRLVCTYDKTPSATAYRASLSVTERPIDSYLAAGHAYAFLKLVGADPDHAALAQDDAGLFYFGFAGDETLADTLPARLARIDIDGVLNSTPQESQSWLDARMQADGVGRRVFDVLIELGLAPRAPEYLGPDPEQTMDDHTHVRALREMASLSALNPQQASAAFVSAVRAADPVALERILASRAAPGDFLAACPLGPGDVGASLHALHDREGTRCEGPVLADIVECLRVLSAWHVKFDDIDAHSEDTLLVRAAGKDFELVTFLLNLGADPDPPGRNGRTPLLACALTGSMDTAQALLAAGAAVDARDSDGASALQHAVGRGELPLATLLLQHGASADLADHAGRTALMAAPTDAMTRLLCAQGADPALRDNAGQTALHHAAGMRADESMAVLLAQGADPEAASHLGATPLHEAAIAGAEACVRLLLDAGADVNEETDNGLTPLMVAARAGQLAAVKLLLARGADADATTVSGSTAVLLCIDAIYKGARDFTLAGRVQACLDALFDAGADVDAANDWGFTPLHAAASGFDAGLVKLLLAAGAQPSPSDKHGRTPLSLAKAQKHAAMIEALLQAGATETATVPAAHDPL